MLLPTLRFVVCHSTAARRSATTRYAAQQRAPDTTRSGAAGRRRPTAIACSHTHSSQARQHGSACNRRSHFQTTTPSARQLVVAVL